MKTQSPVLKCDPLGKLKDASALSVLVVQKANHVARPVTQQPIHGHTSDYDRLTGEHVVHRPIAIRVLA